MTGYDQLAFRMGIEFEYQITDSDGKPCHWQDLSFSQLKELIARTNSPRNDYMAVKYPGSERRAFYLEGYDLTGAKGEFTGLHVKGMEISTPIAADVYEQERFLVQLYAEMATQLAGAGLRGSAYGSHRIDQEYRGQRGTRDPASWAAAETAMMTWGIHVNVSFPDAVETGLDREHISATFGWFAPALILLSADTPMRGEGPWVIDGVIGKSERSYRRSFTRRPLYFRDDQHFRKEVTCFDVTPRLELIRGYAALTAGLMLDQRDCEWVPPAITDHNMRSASAHGYAARLMDRHFQPVDAPSLVHDALDRAAKSLADHGQAVVALDPLWRLAADRRCPADDTLDAWYAQPSWPAFLARRSELTGHHRES